MMTIDKDFRSPTYGDSVRGFMVKVPIKRTGKFATLPCSGCGYYTGYEALKVMQSYSIKRKLTTTALTSSQYGGNEELTLKEMEELYDGN